MSGRTVVEMKAVMRQNLSAAMKARHADVVTALRTALAVLDNAEAVQPDPEVSATEVARRELSISDVVAVLRGCIDETLVEADGYEALGRPEEARRLRTEAGIIGGYLPPGDLAKSTLAP